MLDRGNIGCPPILAKVIHICRHGVDVASSLVVRRRRLLAKQCDDFRKKRTMTFFQRKEARFADTVRCASLEDGLSLWEEYVSIAQTHAKNLGDRAMEIRYEDFLDDPILHIRFLADFCELSISKKDVPALTRQINKTRAYAYRNDPALSEFSQKVSDRLRAFDYSA